MSTETAPPPSGLSDAEFERFAALSSKDTLSDAEMEELASFDSRLHGDTVSTPYKVPRLDRSYGIQPIDSSRKTGMDTFEDSRRRFFRQKQQEGLSIQESQAAWDKAVSDTTLQGRPSEYQTGRTGYTQSEEDYGLKNAVGADAFQTPESVQRAVLGMPATAPFLVGMVAPVNKVATSFISGLDPWEKYRQYSPDEVASKTLGGLISLLPPMAALNAAGGMKEAAQGQSDALGGKKTGYDTTAKWAERGGWVGTKPFEWLHSGAEATGGWLGEKVGMKETGTALAELGVLIGAGRTKAGRSFGLGEKSSGPPPLSARDIAKLQDAAKPPSLDNPIDQALRDAGLPMESYSSETGQPTYQSADVPVTRRGGDYSAKGFTPEAYTTEGGPAYESPKDVPVRRLGAEPAADPIERYFAEAGLLPEGWNQETGRSPRMGAAGEGVEVRRQGGPAPDWFGENGGKATLGRKKDALTPRDVQKLYAALSSQADAIKAAEAASAEAGASLTGVGKQFFEEAVKTANKGKPLTSQKLIQELADQVRNATDESIQTAWDRLRRSNAAREAELARRAGTQAQTVPEAPQRPSAAPAAPKAPEVTSAAASAAKAPSEQPVSPQERLLREIQAKDPKNEKGYHDPDIAAELLADQDSLLDEAKRMGLKNSPSYLSVLTGVDEAAIREAQKAETPLGTATRLGEGKAAMSEVDAELAARKAEAEAQNAASRTGTSAQGAVAKELAEAQGIASPEPGVSSGMSGEATAGMTQKSARGTKGRTAADRAFTESVDAIRDKVLDAVSDPSKPFLTASLAGTLKGEFLGTRTWWKNLSKTERTAVLEKIQTAVPNASPEQIDAVLFGKRRAGKVKAVLGEAKVAEVPAVEQAPSAPSAKASLGTPKTEATPTTDTRFEDMSFNLDDKTHKQVVKKLGGEFNLEVEGKTVKGTRYDLEEFAKELKRKADEGETTSAQQEVLAKIQETLGPKKSKSSFKQGGSLRRGGGQRGSVYIPGGGEFVEVAGRALDYVRSLGERVSSEARERLSLDHVWPRVEEFDAWLGAGDRRQKYMNATPEEANRRFDRIARGVPAASDVPFIPSGPLNENFPDTVRVWAGHGGRVVIGTVRGEPGSISATTRGEVAPKVWYHMLVPDREGVLQYGGKYTSLRQARTAAEIGIKTGKTPNSFTHPLLKDVRYPGDERYYENGWSGAVDRAAMVADVKARMGGRRMRRNFGSESGQIINPADAVVKIGKGLGHAVAQSVKSIADTLQDLGPEGSDLARRLTAVMTDTARDVGDWHHRIWQPGWDALSPKAKDFLRKHGTEAIDNPDMPMPADAAEFINTRRKLMKINAGENLFIEDKSGLRRSHMLPERHVDHVLTDEAAARYEAQDPATMERWRQMNPGRRFPLDEMAEAPNRYTSDYLKPTNRNALPREYNWPNEDLEQNLEKLDKSYMRRMAQYQAEMKHLGYSDLMEGGDVSSQGEYGKLLAKIKATHGAEAARHVEDMMRNALGRGDMGEWNPGAKAGKGLVGVINQAVATYYLAGNVQGAAGNLMSGGLSADALVRHPKVLIQSLAELAEKGPLETYRKGVNEGVIPSLLHDYSHVEVVDAAQALGHAGRVIRDAVFLPYSAANTVLRTMLYAGSEAKLKALARDLRAGGSARQGALNQLGSEMRLFPEEIDRIEKGEHTQHDLNKFQQQWIKHTSGTATAEERPNWMHSTNPLLRMLGNLRGSSAMTANRTLRGPILEARNGRPARLMLTFAGAVAGAYALDKAWEQMFGPDPRDKDIKKPEEIAALYDAGHNKQAGEEALKWLTDHIQKSWFMGQLGGAAANAARAYQRTKGEGWDLARKLTNATMNIIQLRGSGETFSWPPQGVRNVQMLMEEQERKKAVLGAAK